MFTKKQYEQFNQHLSDAKKISGAHIYLHIEKKCRGCILTAAKKFLHYRKRHDATQAHAVCIFIAEKDKKFAIIGDQAIEKITEPDFWHDCRDLLSEHFQRDEKTKGITQLIDHIANHLSEPFPPTSNDMP